MTQYEVELLDSLEKVGFPGGALPLGIPGGHGNLQLLSDTAAAYPRPMGCSTLYALGGETVAFQVAARAERDKVGNGERLAVQLSGDLAGQVCIRRVGLEPVTLPAYPCADNNYLTKTPAMIPDQLLPLEEGEKTEIVCIGENWNALWLDITLPRDTPAGSHPLTITVFNPEGEQIFTRTLTVKALGEPLPPQTLFHTQWFHCDCLANYYKVPAWSEEHWQIVDRYMAAAHKIGINMLLTPIFTPALDTAVGGERTTNQLLEVTVTNGSYSFGFDRLERWLALCRKNGITELEICHLFTQWGAAAAPKVIATVDGVQKRIFGWDTPSVGGKYTAFLRTLLPQLKEWLAARDMLEHAWFHVSDEPSEENMEQWNAARLSVADLLEGCHLIDALSSFKMYEKGFIKTPVVCEDNLDIFAQANIPGLWTYYCCGQFDEVPNRFIAMPTARSRILGTLLYVYDLAGFLQWGFNFYNNAGSTKQLNPWRDADGQGVWPAGDPFIVYPGEDGFPIESIRASGVREAMQDLRWLRFAEQKLGRETVLAILEQNWQGGKLTMKHYPTDPAYFGKVRRALVEKIGL